MTLNHNHHIQEMMRTFASKLEFKHEEMVYILAQNSNTMCALALCGTVSKSNVISLWCVGAKLTQSATAALQVVVV